MTGSTPDTAIHEEDLTVVLVIYGLYIASLLAFPPGAIIGIVMAHSGLQAAGPVAASHLRFQVRTFWIGLLAWAFAGAAVFWGGLLSVILVGLPLLFAASFGILAIWLWALLRSAFGLAWAVQKKACPRPESLTI